MFCVAGIAGMAINSDKDRGWQWNQGEDPAFSVKISIGNYGKYKDEYVKDGIRAQEVLNVIMIITIIIGSMILRHFQRKVADDIDEGNITPSDYGLMVTGIPLNKTQADVVQYFKGFFPDIDIVYVNYCYNVKDIVKAIREMTKWQQKKAYLMAYKKKILRKGNMTEEDARKNGIDTHPPPMKN